jgi:hypothetical protein
MALAVIEVTLPFTNVDGTQQKSLAANAIVFVLMTTQPRLASSDLETV